MKISRAVLFLLVGVVLAGCSSKKSAVSPSSSSARPIVPEQVISSTDEQVSALLKEARKWIGVPYAYGGHSRGGTDCSGLTMELFQKVYNIRLPRSSAMQQEYSRHISYGELKPGDLVFFATGSNPRRVSHVGLYIGNGRMIHASSSRGVMESGLGEKYWQRKFHSSGRVVDTAAPSTPAAKPDSPVILPEIDSEKLQELYDALDQTIDSIYVANPEIFD